jgi:hypothetical protein
MMHRKRELAPSTYSYIASVSRHIVLPPHMYVINKFNSSYLYQYRLANAVS